MKYGIFGGSFNPPHLGHKKLLDEMTEYLKLDKVFVIPANVSPFKTENDGASNEDRLNMCQLAFISDRYEISDIEISRDGKSYTSDTVDLLKKQFPDDEFYLFMGSDMLMSFDRWYNYQHILDCVTVCAMVRNNDVNTEEMTEFAEKILHRADKVKIVPITPFSVSSTEIRNKIKNNENCENYLNKDVLNYIKDRGLYID